MRCIQCDEGFKQKEFNEQLNVIQLRHRKQKAELWCNAFLLFSCPNTIFLLL